MLELCKRKNHTSLSLEISICQAIIFTKHVMWLVYKWTFIIKFIIIIISTIYIRMFTITSTIPIKQNIKFYCAKYMQIYNKNANNVYNNICFCEYCYYICIFYTFEWMKIAQMVQQVIINLIYYYNINFIFVWMLYFSQVCPIYIVLANSLLTNFMFVIHIFMHDRYCHIIQQQYNQLNNPIYMNRNLMVCSLFIRNWIDYTWRTRIISWCGKQKAFQIQYSSQLMEFFRLWCA